jgi:hypothetical protein
MENEELVIYTLSIQSLPTIILLTNVVTFFPWKMITSIFQY